MMVVVSASKSSTVIEVSAARAGQTETHSVLTESHSTLVLVVCPPSFSLGRACHR